MKFMSQGGQDRWVCYNLNNKRNGYFVDIGAHDGIYFSNTHCLEKELGWGGICVEPHNNRFCELIENRHCICINKAVYRESGKVKFAFSGGIYGARDCMPFPITQETDELVDAITLEELLHDNNAPNVIEYISTDTEGADYEVLLGFPFDKYEVMLWTIEHCAYADDGIRRQKIRDLMTGHGYRSVPLMDDQQILFTFEEWFINPKYITGDGTMPTGTYE